MKVTTEYLLEKSLIEGEQWGCIDNLKKSEIEAMLQDLRLCKSAYTLKLLKAGTRVSRERLMQPLIKVVEIIALLSYRSRLMNQ